MKIRLSAALGCLLLFSGTGCVMTPKLPALHDFGMVSPSVKLDGEAAKSTVTVDAPSWLWDNRIRYRLLYASPTKVGFYGLDQWLAAPPELLQQQLIAGGKIQDYPLQIQLLDFEQQFDAPDKARVLLRLFAEAFSADNKTKLATREFRLEQAAQTADAAGAVKGFSYLVQEADRQIHAWLAGLRDQRRHGRDPALKVKPASK